METGTEESRQKRDHAWIRQNASATDNLAGQTVLLLKDHLPTQARTIPKVKIVLVSEAVLGALLLYQLFQVVPGSTYWFVPCVFICYFFLLIKLKRIKKKNKGARSWKPV